MNAFRSRNLHRIKNIFRERTGVELPVTPTGRSLGKAVLLVAAAVCALMATALGYGLFSSLEGDDLAFRSAYEGGGIVVIEVENRSEKPLHFQERLKLMRWTTGEELEARGAVFFSGTEIAPGATGTMTVDLSAAYDIAALEQPVESGNWYYLVLTNNNFLFGQDWMCSVDFDDATGEGEPPPPQEEFSGSDAVALENIEDALQPYFQADTRDPSLRRALTEQYVTDYTALLADLGANIAPSCSPVLPGNRIDLDLPRLTVGDTKYAVSCNWSSMDTDFKLLAGEGEYAYVISALLPDPVYPDAAVGVPLLYLMTYEKALLTGENSVFLHGQVVPLADLMPCKVHEDDTRLCFEVSSFVYGDWRSYVCRQVAGDSALVLNEERWETLEAVLSHYRTHLPELIQFR